MRSVTLQAIAGIETATTTKVILIDKSACVIIYNQLTFGQANKFHF